MSQKEATSARTTTDILTVLQTQYNMLMVQFYSSFSYIAQRHPLVAPEGLPGQPFTFPSAAPTEPGSEDTSLERTPFPLKPHDQTEFTENQRELAEDLVIKCREILGLIQRLPGVEQSGEEQEAEIKQLSEEVRSVEKQRKKKIKETRTARKRLDDLIMGMSQSIRDT